MNRKLRTIIFISIGVVILTSGILIISAANTSNNGGSVPLIILYPENGHNPITGDRSTPSQTASEESRFPNDTSTFPPAIALWKFDEKGGTTAHDTSSNKNDGALINGPTWKSAAHCHQGSCLSFDGVDDYVDAGDPSDGSLDFASDTDFTIEAWAKPNSTASQMPALLGKYANSHGFITGIGAGGDLYFLLADGTVVEDEFGTPGSVRANHWNHLVFVFDRDSNLTGYVNGIQVGAYNIGTRKGNTSNDGSLLIGKTPGGTPMWNSLIDEVRIYDHARTPAQIAWDYNRGKPIAHFKMDDGKDTATTCDATSSTVYDYSGSANHGALHLNGSPATSTAWTIGKYNCGLSFDGKDDYVDTGVTINTNLGYSVTGWAKVVSKAAGKQYFFGSHQGNRFYIGLDSQGDYSFGYGADYDNFVPADAITNNAWFHWALVGDNGIARYYVNGTEVANLSYSGLGTQSHSNLIAAGRGKSSPYAPDGYLHGLIDDVRFYSYALTPLQIKTEYNQGAARFEPSSGLP